MTRFWVVAAVLGECCTDPHVKDAFVSAPDAGTAIDRFRRRLEKRGYDVGDCSVVKATPAVKKFARSIL